MAKYNIVPTTTSCCDFDYAIVEVTEAGTEVMIGCALHHGLGVVSHDKNAEFVPDIEKIILTLLEMFRRTIGKINSKNKRLEESIRAVDDRVAQLEARILTFSENELEYSSMPTWKGALREKIESKK